MHAKLAGWIGLAMFWLGSTALGQGPGSPIILGRPEPILSSEPPSAPSPRPVTLNRPQPIVRGQMPEVTPPPPPPPPSQGDGLNLKSNADAYNCGVVNNNSDLGGFWTRTGDRISRGWTEITGNIGDMFKGGQQRTAFQSDHAFDSFVSPVSNPFFALDPRSLTEIRPMFQWQHTNNSVPFFAGGNNYFAGFSASVALTENVSLVLNRLGWMWTNPDAPSGEFQDGNGFSSVTLGPKITFYRSTETGTIAAAGLNFELPIGSGRVFQNTGNLSLSPYLTAGQEFLKSEVGSLHVLGTAGYSLSIDSQRSDFFYTSLHVDYNIKSWKLAPLAELNYFYYPTNGSARPLNFEGTDLFNFGSMFVAGHSELTLNIGARYKITENIQLGAGIEFNLLGGSRHLEDYRILFDVIFRY